MNGDGLVLEGTRETTYGNGLVYGELFHLPYCLTSSNGNIFCIAGPLCRELTGDRWIPLTKVSGVELWCFLWSGPEQTVEEAIDMPVIWDTMMLILTSL